MMPSAAMSRRRASRRCARPSGRAGRRPSCGVSIGSPKAAAKRPAIVVAAATVTCWPEDRAHRHLEAVDAPRAGAGPGGGSASGPSAAAISSGRQARSKSGFTRASSAGTAPASEALAVTRSADLRGEGATSIQPACDLARRARGGPCAGSGGRRPPRRPRSRAARGRRASPASRRAGGRRGRRRAGPRSRARGRGLAQLARRHAVARAEEVVEAAQAREAARHRHVEHRQRGVGEQALGEQQALRLRVVDGRDAELLLEDAAQVAVGDVERGGERRRGSRPPAGRPRSARPRPARGAGSHRRTRSPGASSGRQRRHGRKPSPSAAAALGKKRQLRSSGVFAVHTGRQ